jgi:hypothetical protein
MSVAEQRYKVVLMVISDGREGTEVAGKFGVSRQAVHAWLRRYEGADWTAWSTGPTGPGRVPTRWIRWSRFGFWSCGVRTVTGARGGSRSSCRGPESGRSPPSRATNGLCCARAWSSISPGTAPDAHWRRWEGGAPMELWQMDGVGGFLLADGCHAKALTGIDDRSRFCVSAYLMRRERPTARSRPSGSAARRCGSESTRSSSSSTPGRSATGGRTDAGRRGLDRLH